MDTDSQVWTENIVLSAPTDCTGNTSSSVGPACPKKWSIEEDALLASAIDKYGARNWKGVAEMVPGRTHAQCLQRWAKVLKPGLKKGQWTTEEDAYLHSLVARGWKNWSVIAGEIPGRTSKQCRERWFHHLDPSINRGPYTEEEDALILAQHDQQGGRWAMIARMLEGRTGEAVKIRFKTLDRHRKSGSTARCPQITRRRRQASVSESESSLCPSSPCLYLPENCCDDSLDSDSDSTRPALEGLTTPIPKRQRLLSPTGNCKNSGSMSPLLHEPRETQMVVTSFGRCSSTHAGTTTRPRLMTFSQHISDSANAKVMSDNGNGTNLGISNNSIINKLDWLDELLEEVDCDHSNFEDMVIGMPLVSILGIKQEQQPAAAPTPGPASYFTSQNNDNYISSDFNNSTAGTCSSNGRADLQNKLDVDMHLLDVLLGENTKLTPSASELMLVTELEADLTTDGASVCNSNGTANITTAGGECPVLI